MLQQLTVSQVHAIIAACEASNREEQEAFADSPNGIRGNDPRVVERMFHPPAEERHLAGLVEALRPDALTELVALMWTGRGDGNYAESLATAKEDRHEPIYVIEKSPALPDFLRDGLREIGLR